MANFCIVNQEATSDDFDWPRSMDDRGYSEKMIFIKHVFYIPYVTSKSSCWFTSFAISIWISALNFINCISWTLLKTLSFRKNQVISKYKLDKTNKWTACYKIIVLSVGAYSWSLPWWHDHSRKIKNYQCIYQETCILPHILEPIYEVKLTC